MEYDAELINAITPDVLAVLARKRFFQALDDRMCPVDGVLQRFHCNGTHAISVIVLGQLGLDSDEIADIIRVLFSIGGCCDCEILFNIAGASRLKSEYWRARATSISRSDSRFHHLQRGS
jgi:hypothetical protein